MKDLTKQFIKERTKVLIGLDKRNINEIMKYCKKYGIPIPLDNNVMFAGLHKVRLYVINPEITDEMKQKSADWLIEHGFTLDID